MEYSEKILNNKKDAFEFIEKLNDKAYSPMEWAKKESLHLYKCFYPKTTLDCLFVYGETITPTQIAEIPNIGIFAERKIYGSSKKYKGLLNIKGETVLNTEYDDISLFYEIEDTVFMKTEKKGHFGLVCHRHLSNDVTLIVPPKYDDIFDAGEYTFGFAKNNLIGFMTLNGRIIVDAKFKIGKEYNHFYNGKALVCIDSDSAINHYINHYGDIVAYEEYYEDTTFSGQGTSYYPYGDLPDALDAYEGDPDALWNTD